MPSIESFNANVLEVLGVNKPTIKQPKGPKPFHCPQCKVKSTTVADLKMHLKSSHSNVIRRNQLVRKVKKNLNENLSLLDVSEHSIATLDEHPHETPQPSNLILEFDECIIMKKHQMPTPKIGTLFLCNQCEFNSGSKCALDMHIKNMHEENRQTLENKHEVGYGYGLFKCDQSIKD